MTETLFERYKEALRAGHVAVSRGRLEDAAVAYRAALAIAPDRAVPWIALGRVLLRLGEPEEALEACDRALALVPEDDAAILARAQALVVLRRTAEAAEVYDRLAELRRASDRLADAAEAGRRALAIEPTDARRERHAALAAALRAAGGSEPEEGPPPLAPGVDAAAWLEDEGPAPDAGAAVGEVPGGARAELEPAPPDPEALILELEAAADRGDADGAAAAALLAARGYRGRGQAAAAFDACLEGIGVRPADVELHLLLADLAVDRGWTGHAADVYRNLIRLADLEGDPALAAAVRAAADARLPAVDLDLPG